MRIDGQKSSGKVPRGPAELSQCDLQALTVLDRSLIEQMMNGRVAGQKRQAVGQFEPTPIVQGSVFSNSPRADGRLMHQLHGQPRPDGLGRLLGPATQQIPGAQPQMFGHQQPHAGQIAADLVGQSLPHAPFQACRIAGPILGPATADPCGDHRVQFSAWTQLIEFFWQRRSRR